MLKIIGKPTIHPILFYSGKVCGYVVWALLLQVLISSNLNQIQLPGWAAVILLGFATFFIAASTINLGKSTRLGLPEGRTELKMDGLYKISRNPMYLGFNMLTMSGMLMVNHLAVYILGLYSMIIYHWVILGEERFLEQRFPDQYQAYKKKVRRYL